MSLPPAGWRQVELQKVAEIQTGLAKGATKFDDPVELPYLRVANVQDGYLDLTEVKTVKVERSRVDRYRLRCGDVLLTEGGDFDKLGRGAVWQGQIENCLHQNHVFVVRPNPDVLLPEFLSEQTSSPYGKQYFLACAKQTTNLASINSTQLKQFPVLLPPLAEQRKIAQIFGTWDAAIGRLEQLIAALARRKQGLMQRLLTGEVRFAEYKDYEWRVGSFDSFLVLQRGFDLPVLERQEGKIPVIASNGPIDWHNEPKVSGPGVITGRSGTIGSVHYVDSDFWPLNTTLYVRDFQGNYPKFVYYFLQQFDLSRFASGSGVPTLNRNDVHPTIVSFPNLLEQERIAEVMTTCDEELALHRQKLAALRRQKQGLMQRLLTGEVRVKGEAQS